MRTRSRGLLIVLAGVLAGALVACTSSGGDPQSSSPSAAPSSTSSSPTPTPTPSRTGPLTTGPGVRPGEKPPTRPIFTTRRTPADAIDFAGYYIKALDWSYATSDPYLLKQISAPSCQTCETTIEGLAKLLPNGRHVEGGRIIVDSAQLFLGTGDIKADHIIKVMTTQDAGAIVPSRVATDRWKRHRVISYIYVSWARGGWKIVGDLG